MKEPSKSTSEKTKKAAARAQLKVYSPLFKTIYDETEPGSDSIGRGSHYSILRAQHNKTPSDTGFFDFAIIWDEDHDIRVIEVLEDLYKTKKLSNYIIVGERKGCFTAVLHPDQKQTVLNSLPSSIEINAGNDNWDTEVVTLKDVGNHGRLIHDGKAETETYITAIINKWNLGKKPVKKAIITPQKVDHSDDPEVQKIEKSLAKTAVDDVYQDTVVRAQVTKDKRTVSMYGFPDQTKRNAVELKWQQYVTSKFFRVGKALKPGKPSHDIYGKIKAYLAEEKPAPLVIDGFPRRSFIIALSKILTEYGSMPELKFQLGITVIELSRKDSRTKRQQGNFSMLIPSLTHHIAYGEGCVKRMQNFCNPAWDKDSDNPPLRLKMLLSRFKAALPIMTSFSHAHLTKYGNVRIESDKYPALPEDPKIKENIHFLNGLLFLVTVTEVLVRLYRTEDGTIYDYEDESGKTSDAFPVAMAQTRSLTLLLSGEISFDEFLGETPLEGYDAKQHRALYGAVTGKNTMDHLEVMFRKLSAINLKHDATIMASLPAWKEFRETYLGSNPNGSILSGRSRMYFDLKNSYGTGDESDEDSSGYSDAPDSDIDEDTVAFKSLRK